MATRTYTFRIPKVVIRSKNCRLAKFLSTFSFPSRLLLPIQTTSLGMVNFENQKIST